MLHYGFCIYLVFQAVLLNIWLITNSGHSLAFRPAQVTQIRPSTGILSLQEVQFI